MIRRVELDLAPSPEQLARRVRRPGVPALFLDGRGGFEGSWRVGPLVALEPRLCFVADAGRAREGLARLDRLVTSRRSVGGVGETGVAALLAYDLFEDSSGGDGLPSMVVLAVDRSVRFSGRSRGVLSASSPDLREDDLHRLLRGLGDPPSEDRAPLPAAITSVPRTSLPRETYLAAVTEVRRRIALGDIYQANLCQRFEAPYEGDPFELYVDLSDRLPAPRSAWVEVPGLALASASPEMFVSVHEAGRIETRPIKGTRPRGATPELDRAAARELTASAKDRAELVMIVDLERNDLSRVCRPGSVEVPELAELRSYPAVHHLVATVRGCLRNGTTVEELVRAVFPGGSITGAPKRRAIEILRGLEPVGRNFFTGSLLWFGDDGTLDSSILIRTLVFAEDRVFLGAGGGIVTDSDPEDEWRESNHKARALAQALGFDPEQAR